MEETITRWLTDPIVAKLTASLIAVVVVTVLVRVAHRVLIRFIADADTRYRSRKFITFIGYVAGALVIGAIFSNQFGSLTVAFGVAGAGIAFALQEVIASVAGWVAMVFGHFYRVGDRVLLGGIRGDVIDIGVLRTTLMECGDWVNGDLYNGRIVRVANSFVFKDPVYNYSGDFPFLWDEIVVPVKHGSDVGLTDELLGTVAAQVVGEYTTGAAASWQDVVKRYRIEAAQVAPLLTMTADENWMSFTLRYVTDYRRRRGTKDALWRGIIAAFAEHVDRVEIAFSTLYVSTPPLDVRLTGPEPLSQAAAT